MRPDNPYVITIRNISGQGLDSRMTFGSFTLAMDAFKGLLMSLKFHQEMTLVDEYQGHEYFFVRTSKERK